MSPFSRELSSVGMRRLVRDCDKDEELAPLCTREKKNRRKVDEEWTQEKL